MKSFATSAAALAALVVSLPFALFAQSPTIAEALEMSSKTGAPIFAVAGQET